MLNYLLKGLIVLLAAYYVSSNAGGVLNQTELMYIAVASVVGFMLVDRFLVIPVETYGYSQKAKSMLKAIGGRGPIAITGAPIAKE